LLDALVTQPAS